VLESASSHDVRVVGERKWVQVEARGVGLRTRLCLSLVVLFGCSDPEAGAKPGKRDSGPETDAGPSDAATDSGEPEPPPPSCAQTECDPKAICSDADGPPQCTCFEGYEGDGESCTDIDECADDNGGCDTNAACVNRQGGYRCLCDETFAGDGETCTDTDECADALLNTCDPNAECSDNDAGFGCACGAGFTGDGFGCGDVDECADVDLFECAANASCKNAFGSYECECNPGWSGDATSECQGLCEIADCDGDKLCRVVRQATECSASACALGFVGNGATCTPIAAGDNCGQCDGGDDDIAGAVCTGTAGAGACTCAPGYAGSFPSCTDENECSAQNGLCGDAAQNRCTNLPGGHFCDCQPGYERDGADGPCVDVNECVASPRPCHPDAACTNLNGSFSCACKPGFSGDGAVCRDVNECEEESDNCLDDGSARCVNTAGDFECRCRRGYTGDGVSACDNLDECSDPNLHDCDESATCTDLSPEDDPLGYECTCPEGLGGDGTECTDVNECLNAALNDCAEHATCVNDVGGFHCECRPPFAGDNPAQCHCDLSGYWAMRQDVDVCWCDRKLVNVTIISGGALESTAWELHKYTYDGETIEVEKKLCGGDNDPDFISPFFGETYGSYIPEEVVFGLDLRPGKDIPQSGIVPGSAFTTPDEALVDGIDIGDDLECEDCWPASYGDVNPIGGAPPAWVDTEGDGEPGVTLWPRVPSDKTAASTSAEPVYYDYIPANLAGNDVSQRAGCVSVASRVITYLDVNVASCDRIVGEVVNVKSEGRVASCTFVGGTRAMGSPAPDEWADDITCDAADWAEVANDCDTGALDRLDDQDQSVTSSATFELVKIADLDDDVDCLDVRAALPAIERATPTPIDCNCP
jgi:hypothetical protein